MGEVVGVGGHGRGLPENNVSDDGRRSDEVSSDGGLTESSTFSASPSLLFRIKLNPLTKLKGVTASTNPSRGRNSVRLVKEHAE